MASTFPIAKADPINPVGSKQNWTWTVPTTNNSDVVLTINGTGEAGGTTTLAFNISTDGKVKDKAGNPVTIVTPNNAVARLADHQNLADEYTLAIGADPTVQKTLAIEIRKRGG